MNIIQSDIKTMNSEELAELLQLRHDNVRQAAMNLQSHNIITFTEIVVKGNGRPKQVLQFDERNSIIIAAKLNDKLLAAVVDRWKELESAAQKPAVALPDFSNPAAAARAWAEQYEISTAAQEQLQIAAPKVAFVEKYVESTGNKGFREVAKLLKIKEPKFRIFLADNYIMYQLAGNWTAYQKHIDVGRFHVSTGTKNEHAYNTVKFTPKGVAWISELIEGVE